MPDLWIMRYAFPTAAEARCKVSLIDEALHIRYRKLGSHFIACRERLVTRWSSCPEETESKWPPRKMSVLGNVARS